MAAYQHSRVGEAVLSTAEDVQSNLFYLNPGFMVSVTKIKPPVRRHISLEK